MTVYTCFHKKSLALPSCCQCACRLSEPPPQATAIPHWWGPMIPKPSTVNRCCCSIAKPVSIITGNGSLQSTRLHWRSATIRNMSVLLRRSQLGMATQVVVLLISAPTG